MMKRGTKLIVIDPVCSWEASRAEIWLQVRPGTDGALALGLLNVIINESGGDNLGAQREVSSSRPDVCRSQTGGDKIRTAPGQ